MYFLFMKSYKSKDFLNLVQIMDWACWLHIVVWQCEEELMEVGELDTQIQWVFFWND
jgi:hypothetical protein